MKQIPVEMSSLNTAVITKHRPGRPFNLLPSDLSSPQQRSLEIERIEANAYTRGWSERAVNAVRRLIVAGDPGFAGGRGLDVLATALSHEKTTAKMASFILKTLAKIDVHVMEHSRLARIMNDSSLPPAVTAEAVELIAKRADDHIHTREVTDVLAQAGKNAVRALHAQPDYQYATTIRDSVKSSLMLLYGESDKFVSDYADSALDSISAMEQRLALIPRRQTS